MDQPNKRTKGIVLQARKQVWHPHCKFRQHNTPGLQEDQNQLHLHSIFSAQKQLIVVLQRNK